MGVRAVKPKVKIPPLIEMEVAIVQMFGIRTHIAVPNISWGFNGMHECDLFLIKKTGIAVEVEIKRSKSDLLADFKKKHTHEDKRITEFYYALPEELYEKCKEYIPVDAGIITTYYYTNYKKETNLFASIKRSAVRRKGSRKLTPEEQLKITRLGCMRIWTLKQKLIKNGRTNIQK